MNHNDPSKHRRRAFARERDLVRLLWKKGFACMRAPASGSKTKKTIYPDVIAVWRGKVLVFEVKTSEKYKTIYIPRHQVEKIRVFAERAGGKAFIAVKIIGQGEPWKFIPIEQLEHTGSGNYKITVELLRRGLGVNDLMKYAGMLKSLNEYDGDSS